MIVVRGSDFLPPGPGVSVTVGNFDGVHRGHRELVRRAVERARAEELRAVVLTFDPHPLKHFPPRGEGPFRELSSLGEKAELLADAGVEALVAEDFASVCTLSPRDFASLVLADRLGARHVVVGYDFAFGRGRIGTTEQLSDFGERFGFSVDVVPPLVHGGAPVSSTRVREAVLSGRVREAEELLCRPYRMSGPVVHGAGRGKGLGFPTANVRFTQEIVPAPGVYVVEAGTAGGAMRRAVASVGTNPTFGDNPLALEVFLLSGGGDLYGKTMAVDFRERIREQRRFDSADALVRQIGEDVRFARDLVLPAPLEEAG
jgi:riboflavin kinase/FMN adenylyltransferase